MITRESLNLQTPYEPPAGNLEGLIARIFAEVFELDQIGAADEFFDVGGDSLLGEVLSEQIFSTDRARPQNFGPLRTRFAAGNCQVSFREIKSAGEGSRGARTNLSDSWTRGVDGDISGK
jgi:hypothetical protein